MVYPPTHPLSTIPREARVSCVIGVSNELPPLHPVYPLCLCMCAVWRWATPLGMHGGISCSDQRDKEREQRLREARARPGESRNNLATETTTRHSQRAADGSAVSTVTKTERLVHSSKRLSRAWGSGRAQGNSCTFHTLLCPFAVPLDDGTQTARTTTVESSFVRRSESKATCSLLCLPAACSLPFVLP